MHREEVQDLFGNDTSTAQQVESKRSILRASIRRIHGMIVALPSQANSTTQGIAERIKRAKATELSKIASELNRQELQDLQAKAHRGVLFHSLVPDTPATIHKGHRHVQHMTHGTSATHAVQTPAQAFSRPSPA
jgi:hypothetical protein